ncbi:MAG: hypothetical protein ACLQNG_17870 [Acidimicrobiales bacterium]
MAVIKIVTGFLPQLKVMIPPALTAASTAADVQLAGLPWPITWLGWLVLTALPAGGTGKCPSGLPKSGRELAWTADRNTPLKRAVGVACT